MDVIPEPIQFEWDKGNINKNLKKHRVTNEEAEEIFVNNPLISKDPKHSTKREKRYQSTGLTNKGKTLFISFTLRNNKIRIISARLASRKERKVYEQS